MRTNVLSGPSPAAVATAKEKLAIDHVIANFVGDKNGPTLIVIGGLHGNETAGTLALKSVADQLEVLRSRIRGRVYLLAGNTRAIGEGVRFIDSDLNRHWTSQRLSERSGLTPAASEDHELRELDQILDQILITAENEVYVLDLHSTSADGVPFATVGDTLRNRAFAQKFPVTILLGVEEQLDGTLLEYLNDAGAITLGFEGGQHESPSTVARHHAMTWLALVNSGVLDPDDVVGLDGYSTLLSAGVRHPAILEILHRHAVNKTDEFEMNPGFNNFDPVRRGQVIARDKNGRVLAEDTGLLIMPLYQKLGDDGYFIARRVSGFWLWLSGVLRRLGVQNLMHLLPGVVRDRRSPEILTIDTRIAKLFPLQIFHLLGFRKRRWENDKLIVSRRKHDTDSPFGGEN